NATAKRYEGPGTIQELFEEQAARSEGRTALVFEGSELSYGELNARANRLAHRLRELGVGPDVLVGICAERSVEMVMGLLAVLKAGGAYLPLDPAYPAQRLAYMLEDARPKVLLTQTSLLPLLQELPAQGGEAGWRTLCLDAGQEWAGHGGHDPQPVARPEHLAYVIYTSGSTGRPKGVAVEQAGIVNRLRWMQDEYGLGAGERVLQKTPFSFDVSVWEFFWPLITGATLVVARPGGHQDVDYLSGLIAKERITTLHFVPPMLDVFLATAEVGRCATLRRVICSGQALPLELQERFLAQLPGVELHNLYGPTEASVDVSYWACRAGTPLASVPIGRPIANIQLHVLDEQLQPVPVGVAGELHIAGIGLARGYLGRGALTAEKFIPNPFGAAGSRMYKSGDLARYLPDGSIEYLGRMDEQVKIRGLRIELGEVEAVLKAQAGVRDAVVLAREDVPGDKRLVAYIVADETLAIDVLRSALSAQLADYMVPSAFVQLERLPLSPNGKLDRKALPAPDGGAYAQRVYEAPVGETEARLAAIWRELLQLEQVGRNDNFFELGGHSLLAVTLVERMRRAGLAADVRTLFSAPTIAALAASVNAGDSIRVQVPPNGIPDGCTAITPDMLPLAKLDEAEIARIVASVPGGAANVQDIYPLAPLQEGILFHHMMAQQGDIYLLPTLVAFDRRERLDQFLAAMQRVVDRHDILRTALAWEGLAEPVQVVWREAPLQVRQVELDPGQDDAARQLRERFDPRHYRIDLRKAPLLHCFIAHDAANERWLLQVLAHHAAIDHTALEILVAEIRAVVEGRADELPAALPFRNFVAQAGLGVSRSEHEAFFKAMLGDIEEPTAPYGVLSLKDDGAGLDEYRELLAPALSKRLRERARHLGVSAASVMHLAWAQVLAGLAGREEVVFGTVLFGRLQGGAGADRALGMFINTLPVRIKVAGQGAEAGVRAVHALLAQLFKHEHAPLALAQRCSAVPAQLPLFSALLNFRHSVPRQDDDGWEGVTILASSERTSYPLTMSVDDLGGDFALTVQADLAISARRVLAYMLTVLSQLVDALENAPARPLDGMSVLPAEEKALVLEKFNATQAEYPDAAGLHVLFQEQAARTPGAVALVHGDMALTYADLNSRANQLAHYLRAAGAAEEGRVVIALPRSVDFVVAVLAVLKTGAAYVPLDMGLPAARRDWIIEDSGASLLLGSAPVDAPAGVACIDIAAAAIAAQPKSDLAAAVDGRAGAYAMYTSGSTGVPKGVDVPHRAVARLVINNGYARFNADDRVAFAANPAFDASTLELWAPLLNGGTLVVIDQESLLDPQRFAAALQQQRVSVLWMTVGLFNQYAEALAQSIRTLRYLIVGGDSLDPAVIRQVLRANPPRHLLNGYGPTETTTFATTYEITAVDDDAVAIPIGRPIGNTQVYILDRHGNPAPLGVAGEIYIGGAGVARGYLNRPELTRERFLPDPFSGEPEARMYKTGDLGRWLPDGTVEYLG
ncbi:amino acid adenylation domain-containing protein, partial [Ramlibacter sp.]|uniref:amino acid adenylation domain-containing protein n=1 Tax=Ramlibacter sp. TaxID=1917967 RepID=UPI002D50F36F